MSLSDAVRPVQMDPSEKGIMEQMKNEIIKITQRYWILFLLRVSIFIRVPSLAYYKDGRHLNVFNQIKVAFTRFQ
jgi:hypothetical protein